VPTVNIHTPRSRGPRGLGRQLRVARLEQGLSQTELATLSGLSCKTVQRIEAGMPPSEHTALLLECALDMPDGSFSPDWELPPGPVETCYGSRVRARRRALGKSLKEVGVAAGVSAAALSRFERGLSTPRRWIAEWSDALGTKYDAIIARPLAHALGFEHEKELHEFCMSGDVSKWHVVGDRRSALWLPHDNLDPGVAPSRAFPTWTEIGKAYYRAGNAED
jgi:transcriptional regulator with XRE-family HTH domain